MRSLSLASLLAALLAGCLPSGQEDSRCSGYLGCSAKEVILPVDGGPDAPPPPLPPIGTGCGKPLPADQPPTVPGTPMGYKQYTVMGTGATLAGPQPDKVGERTFWVRVPADYDPNHPYHVIYIGEGFGAHGQEASQSYHLYDESMGGTEEAIYVAIGLPDDNVNSGGYDNRDGLASQEWEAFELFHTVVDQNYCVDNDRVYVVGFDTGAMLANQWGCYFAGDGTKPASDPTKRRRFAPQYHIRAEGAVESLEPDNGPPCNGPVAGLWIQGQFGFLSLQQGIDARDRALRMNGCADSTNEAWHPELTAPLATPIAPASCVKFTSCPAQYPVVFCTVDIYSGPFPITAFKLFFDELSATP